MGKSRGGHTFSVKGQIVNMFSFVSQSYWTLLLQSKGGHRQHVSEWARLHSVKTLFVDTEIWILFNIYMLQNSLLLLLVLKKMEAPSFQTTCNFRSPCVSFCIGADMPHINIHLVEWLKNFWFKRRVRNRIPVLKGGFSNIIWDSSWTLKFEFYLNFIYYEILFFFWYF